MSFVVLLAACTGTDEPIELLVEASPTPTGTSDASSDTGGGTGPAVLVEDVGASSGYDDFFLGHWKRGRAAAVLDFDGDGDWDVFAGNPGDESLLLVNVSTPGQLKFEAGQVLGDGPVMWGATAGDYDNDGDPDLFVTTGGNEDGGQGLDFLFRNDEGVFVDVSEAAGVWARNLAGEPVISNHASGFFWDANGDAHLDLFSNHHITPGGQINRLERADGIGINNVFISNGDGTFTDRYADLRMYKQWSTRSSSYLDFDNDGDLDLYENNWIGPNALWRNGLVETGSLAFENATAELSLGGADLAFPGDRGPMSSLSADFNQDGWEDLLVFRRGDRTAGEPLVHPEGHLIWINMQGQGFVEVAAHTNVNVDFQAERSHYGVGVMGSQAADLNADGIPDIFVGNGSPERGEVDDLMVSTGLKTVTIEGVGEVVVPVFESWSARVNAPSPAEDLRHDFQNGLYPYRTHGSAFADFDGDGLYELGVHNGGPHWGEDEDQQSPNQLWKFTFRDVPHYLRVDLHGDGVTMPRDPIGARVRARVSGPEGERWVYATMRSSTGFGAQNDRDVFLGLGQSTEVLELWVTWLGRGEQPVPVDGVDCRITVTYDPDTTQLTKK